MGGGDSEVEITSGRWSISVHLIGMTSCKYKWSDYYDRADYLVSSSGLVNPRRACLHKRVMIAVLCLSSFNTRLSARVVSGLWVLESVSVCQLSIFRHAEAA